MRNDMNGFYQYVKQYRKEGSARGDLARDMIADREFPKRATRYENLFDYLESKNGKLERTNETFRN
jgi:uncharacterized protein YozE (UPF0346 family)